MIFPKSDLDIEEKESHHQDTPLQQAIQQIGIADYNVTHHLPPPSFSSPLSLYYQFIYNHDMSLYQMAASNFSTLQDYYPWWRKGIDRYSSILYILKQKQLLSSLYKRTQQFESSLQEVLFSLSC